MNTEEKRNLIAKALNKLSEANNAMICAIQDVVDDTPDGKVGYEHYDVNGHCNYINTIHHINDDYVIRNPDGKDIGVLEDNTADELYDILLGIDNHIAEVD